MQKLWWKSCQTEIGVKWQFWDVLEFQSFGRFRTGQNLDLWNSVWVIFCQLSRVLHEFWMMLYHLPWVLEVHVFLWISFDHGYDLEREHFLRIFDWYPYLEAMWVYLEVSEWMRCHVERGYGNLTPCVSTLWVRVKRHAIHHWLYSYAQRICGRLLLEVMEDGREHSTYCGRNLVCDHPVSQCSIGLRTYCFWHQDDVIDQCWPVIAVYGSVLHLILDSTWVWYSLLLELKIPTLVWHWNCLLCPRHLWTRCTEKLILSKWWEHS